MATLNRKAASASSMPLGGLETGYFRLDTAGDWFSRQVSGLHEKFAKPLHHTFLTLSVLSGAAGYARILRAEKLDGAADANIPPALGKTGIAARLQFPKAEFRLADVSAPIAAQWSIFSPVIPYDHDASCLPAVLVKMELENNGVTPIVCAVAFNVDLPAGEGPDPWQSPIYPFTIELNEKTTSIVHGAAGAPMAHTQQANCNALMLGEAPPQGKDTQLCIAVHSDTRDAWDSVGAWDPDNGDEAAMFWRGVVEQGVLPRSLRTSRPCCAAACCRLALEPGQRQRVLFVMTWHNRENGVVSRLWRDAADAARHALLHAGYLHAAVQDWQARVAAGTPGWLARALNDGVECFVTQGRLSVLNEFEWTDKPTGPGVFHSLALLLFYPRFQSRRMAARLKDPARAMSAPAVCDLVLETYRDFLLTGNQAHLEQTYRQLSSWLDALRPAEIPESGRIMGLRLAAQRAMAHLSEAVHDNAGLARWLSACRRGRLAFEERFWGVAEQRYLDPADAAQDPSGVLMGHCCAAWLRMDDLLHVDKLVATLNALDGGLSPMRLSTSSLACLALLEQSLSLADIHGGRWIARLGARFASEENVDPRLAWPVFLASSGFIYAVAAQRLMIALASPPRDQEMVTPLMTPLCFGVLRYREPVGTNGYEARIHLSLGSPVMVREVTVRLPAHVAAVSAVCTHEHEIIPCTTQVWEGTGMHHLSIALSTPLRLAGAFRVFLRETPSSAISDPAKKGWRR